MTVEKHRLFNPAENGFDVLGKLQRVHEMVRARLTVISGAVHDCREPEPTKDAATADHSVTVSSPTMGKHNDSPGLAFGCNMPNFKHASSFSGDGRLGDLPPIRFVLHRISWELQDKVRQPQSDEEIEDAHSQNQRRQSQLFRLHSECNDETGMPLKVTLSGKRKIFFHYPSNLGDAMVLDFHNGFFLDPTCCPVEKPSC